MPFLPARPRAAALALLALVVGLLLAVAGPAAAHSQLASSSPADGEVLEAAPAEVAFTFNEPVTAPRGAARVFAGDGERVDGGSGGVDPEDPTRVVVGLPDDLAAGTYAASFRVTSADGHPVRGAIVFSVGGALEAGDDLVAGILAGGADRPFAVVAAVLRWLGYLGVLLAAGAVVFAWRLRAHVGSDVDAVAAPLRLAATVVAVSGVLAVPVQQALVSGTGLAGLVDPAGLAAVVATPFGWSAMLRAAAAAALLLLARAAGRAEDPGARLARLGSPVALGLAAVLAGSLLLEGHTLTTGPAWLVVSADAAHVAAAAVWLGGLVPLITLLRRRRREDDPVATGRLVADFSSLATVAVLVVAGAGLALAWAEVRALRALTTTAYGTALLVKSALVLPVLGLGLYNRQRLVPALRRRARRLVTVEGRPVPAGGSGDTAPPATGAVRRRRLPEPGTAWRHLRRTVACEAGMLVAVLGATAVLVNLQPAAEAAGITGAYSTEAPFGDDGTTILVTLDPNRVGANELHVYLLGPNGRPSDAYEELALDFVQPELQLGPIERTARVAGPGHWVHAGSELSLPGTWEITARSAPDRFSLDSGTITTVVNP